MDAAVLGDRLPEVTQKLKSISGNAEEFLILLDLCSSYLSSSGLSVCGSGLPVECKWGSITGSSVSQSAAEGPETRDRDPTGQRTEWKKSRLKCSILTFRTPHNNRGSVGSSLEMFSPVWKFQSRRAILSRAAKRGGFKRGGFPDLDLSFLFCPFLSFFGLSRFFWAFPDLRGDGPGIFLICPFPLSQPI